MGLVIEPLGPRHDRKTFACGSADIDAWFRHRADQDAQRDGTRVLVAVDDALGVIGVYRLSFITLAVENLPETQAHLLPRPGAAPAALVGSLARDKRVRGQGIGAALLVDAIQRVLTATKTLPLIAIVAETSNPRTATFYEAFGFQPFPLTAGRSFLLTASAMAALGRGKP